MKTTILICMAFFFGLTISAQNSDAQPNSPYASFTYEQMSPADNDPLPWFIDVTMGDSDYNSIQLRKISVKNIIAPDLPAFPNSAYERHYKKPPLSYRPNERGNYSIKVRKPGYCIY